MIRSIEFDLETKSEANQRFASKAGMFAKSERVKAQRSAVKQVLASTFGAHVPPLHVVLGNVATSNRIEVRLVRLAPGLLDDDNLRGALKAVRDAVAAWIGIDDRNPIASWGYDQTRAPQHVYRVRIEVEDLSPGEPRRVVLAETASAGREASARVKRQVSKATKSLRDVPAWAREHVEAAQKRRAGDVVQAGRVLSYQPEAAAAGASSGARRTAEERFAKLTGKPTATDLRDAAERVLVKPKHAMAGDPWCRCPACGHVAPLGKMQDERGMLRCGKCGSRKGVAPHRAPAEGLPRTSPDRDPGDEAPARDLADCETCGAKVPDGCKLDVGGRVVFGVHVARARAAGLHVPPDDRAQVRPAREPMRTFTITGADIDAVRKNARKLATVPGQARLVARRVFLALPWEQRTCEACEGRSALIGVEPGALATTCSTCGGRGYRLTRLAPEPSLQDVAINRPSIPVKVPLAHRTRWGLCVTLYRREVTIPAHGLCWVYEAARPEGT